jgi:hypothetical protein
MRQRGALFVIVSNYGLRMPEIIICVWFSNFLPRLLSLSVLVFRLPSVKSLPLHSLVVVLLRSRNCLGKVYDASPVHCNTLTVVRSYSVFLLTREVLK